MRATVVLVMLVVACSADLRVKRQMLNDDCSDQATANIISNLPASCSDSNITNEDRCGEGCLGRVCTHFSDNGYSSLCSLDIATRCFENFNVTPADSCLTCLDARVMMVIPDLPDTCDISNIEDIDLKDFCTSDCAGKVCTLYKNSDNDYPDFCRASFAQHCVNGGLDAPKQCNVTISDGALALVTMKEVTVVVILFLVAAFLVL